jgi:hypothetical protein
VQGTYRDSVAAAGGGCGCASDGVNAPVLIFAMGDNSGFGQRRDVNGTGTEYGVWRLEIGKNGLGRLDHWSDVRPGGAFENCGAEAEMADGCGD